MAHYISFHNVFLLSVKELIANLRWNNKIKMWICEIWTKFQMLLKSHLSIKHWPLYKDHVTPHSLIWIVIVNVIIICKIEIKIHSYLISWCVIRQIFVEISVVVKIFQLDDVRPYQKKWQHHKCRKHIYSLQNLFCSMWIAILLH